MYRNLRLAIAGVLFAATIEAQTVERFRAAYPAIAPVSTLWCNEWVASLLRYSVSSR